MTDDPAARLARVALGDEQPFLLARLLTDRLRRGASEDALSITTAFEDDVAAVQPAPGRDLPMAPTEFARALLLSLTWACGAGFPEDEWRAVSVALLDVTVSRDDVSWVLEQLGHYVVQDGEVGVAVYRLAHPRLIDHLRPPFRTRPGLLFDPAAEPVTAVLLARYRFFLDHEVDAREPSYLWLYAARHAAQCGSAGVRQLGALAELDHSLDHRVAEADLEVARRLRDGNQAGVGLRHAERAVTCYRQLAETESNPAFLPGLAAALSDLADCHVELGNADLAFLYMDECHELRRKLAASVPSARPPAPEPRPPGRGVPRYESWQEFVEAEIGRLELYTRSTCLTVGLSREQVPDVLQEAIVGLARSWPRARAAAVGPQRYMHSIIQYKARDARWGRRAADRMNDRAGHMSDDVAASLSSWVTTEDEVVHRDDISALLGAVARLPDVQQETVRLVKLMGLTNGEAAARLGVSQGAVRQAVHKAMMSLRVELQSRRE